MKKLLRAFTMVVITAFAGFLWAGVPDNGMPGNGIPDNGVPGNGLPQNGVPSNGVPKNGVAGNGTNSNGTVKNGTSENISQVTSIGSQSSGAGAGKATFNEFKIKKPVGKSHSAQSGKNGGGRTKEKQLII